MRNFDHKPVNRSDLDDQHRKLKRGYMLGLGLIGLLALASLGLLIAQIDSQRRYARMIDTRETQRALTLRGALFSLLLDSESNAFRRRQYRRTIAGCLDEIARLQKLLPRAAGVAVPTDPNRARDDRATRNLDAQLRWFTASERVLLARRDSEPVEPHASEISDFLAAVPSALRDAFDDEMESLRGASLRQTHLYQGLATGTVCVLLLGLVAEARWIFQPLVLGIRRETRALAASRQRLGAVFDTVGEAIIVADADNLIQSVNSEAARVWQYAPAELVGRKLNGLVLPGRKLAPADWREMFPVASRVETVGTRKDGQPFGLELTLTSTRQDAAAGSGDGIFFTICARDITDRLESARQLIAARDAALDAGRAKGAFVASMSHEIRAPLDGIRDNIDALADGVLTDQQRHGLESILRHGDALGGVLDDLLDFSNIESGKLTLEIADFDLRHLVEGAADVLAGRAVQKQLELLAYVAPDVPTALRGDAGRLRQILLNLLGNALKFTAHGEVILEVSLEAEEADHVTLRFSVRDTGPGIAPEDRPNLFHAFAQGEESAALRAGGRGLSLTICRQLVERMDGVIGVESGPGCGSTFWFTARLEKQTIRAAMPIGENAESEAAMLARLQGVRILIVDDNATCRELVGARMAAWGMLPATAENGGAALAQLREQALAGEPFDLAMLDLNLGSMDGFTLAWAIHSQPMLAATRLVLVTALGLENDHTADSQVGILASVSKPLKHGAVLQVLFKVMAGDQAGLPARGPGGGAKLGVRTNRISLESAPLLTGGRRVLLVDDNPINRKLTLRQLANLGFRADAVTNGREALAALRAQQYGLVILDLHMPVMDGYETARAIRRLLRGQREDHLALIAMTANRAKGDRERCLDAGMNDYLSKPVRQDELGNVLTRWSDLPRQAPDSAAAPASLATETL